MEPSWPQRILCPVDFSEASAGALRQAGRLAAWAGGSLTAVHTHSWEAPAYFTASRIEELERQIAAVKHEAESELGKFVAAALPGRSVNLVVVDAAPADGILATATARQSDLLVMGSHGRSGWNRFVLGSVTERIVQQTSLPVLTMRAAAGGAAALAPLRRILCPVNESAAARPALRHAARLASIAQAELVALHVVEPGAPPAPPALCNWMPDGDRARCQLRELVESGNAEERILALAEQMPADLIVIGAHRRALREATVLGATSIRVIRHSAVPVLTVFA